MNVHTNKKKGIMGYETKIKAFYFCQIFSNFWCSSSPIKINCEIIEQSNTFWPVDGYVGTQLLGKVCFPQ